MDEFVFPARLAFEIENARLGGRHIHQAHDPVVVDILLAGERFDGELKTARTGEPCIEHQRFSLRRRFRFAACSM